MLVALIGSILAEVLEPQFNWAAYHAITASELFVPSSWQLCQLEFYKTGELWSNGSQSEVRVHARGTCQDL